MTGANHCTAIRKSPMTTVSTEDLYRRHCRSRPGRQDFPRRRDRAALAPPVSPIISPVTDTWDRRR